MYNVQITLDTAKMSQDLKCGHIGYAANVPTTKASIYIDMIFDTYISHQTLETDIKQLKCRYISHSVRLKYTLPTTRWIVLPVVWNMLDVWYY